MTDQSPLAALLDSALQIAADDTINAGLGPANAVLTNLQTNGSASNLTAQALAFQAGILTALPNLENEVIEQIAAVVQKTVDAEAVAAQAKINAAGTNSAA